MREIGVPLTLCPYFGCVELYPALTMAVKKELKSSQEKDTLTGYFNEAKILRSRGNLDTTRKKHD